MTHLIVHPCRVNSIDSLVLSNITLYYPIMLRFTTNLWWHKNGHNWFKKMDDGIHFPIQLWIWRWVILTYIPRTSTFHPY